MAEKIWAPAISVSPAVYATSYMEQCLHCTVFGFMLKGTFDWLDSFLEEKPTYTELSDRHARTQIQLAVATCTFPRTWPQADPGVGSDFRPSAAKGGPTGTAWRHQCMSRAVIRCGAKC